MIPISGAFGAYGGYLLGRNKEYQIKTYKENIKRLEKRKKIYEMRKQIEQENSN